MLFKRKPSRKLTNCICSICDENMYLIDDKHGNTFYVCDKCDNVE